MQQNPYIEIRTGSDSDITKIKEVYTVLDDLKIPYHARILSAHRTPLEMITVAQNLSQKGYRVSIAAAGGSAHLAGMTASETILPVIALPVKTSLGNGLDSLLSMIQMPNGVPNACVGINDGYNAGVLAARIAYFNNIEVRVKIAQKEKKELKGTPKITKKINIITTQTNNLDLKILEEFGVIFNFNQPLSSYEPVLYIDTLEVIETKIMANIAIDHIGIIAPISNEINFDFNSLIERVKGSYGWAGINRVENGQLLVLQILALFYPELSLKLNQHRVKMKNSVIKKDQALLKKQLK